MFHKILFHVSELWYVRGILFHYFFNAFIRLSLECVSVRNCTNYLHFWHHVIAFSALTLLLGGMVLCLGRGADLHMAQLMPLLLTVFCSSKSRLVLPFWYWLTQVVPDKGPLNRCCCCCLASFMPTMHTWMFFFVACFCAISLPCELVLISAILLCCSWLVWDSRWETDCKLHDYRAVWLLSLT